MKWTREPEGYRSGRYFIQRHEVDDRAYDGGIMHTYWNLHIDGSPFDQYTTLRDAKREVARIEARRT